MKERLTEVEVPHRGWSERSLELTPDEVSHGVHIRGGQLYWFTMNMRLTANVLNQEVFQHNVRTYESRISI